MLAHVDLEWATDAAVHVFVGVPVGAAVGAAVGTAVGAAVGCIGRCSRRACKLKGEKVLPAQSSSRPQSALPRSAAPATGRGAPRELARAQLSGRNRWATLVVTITTHIGVTGLASYHRYRRIEHVHWITSKHWTESDYCHSFGSREMSELWLPGNIFSPLSGGTVPEAQSGFFTWDCGWLMANK